MLEAFCYIPTKISTVAAASDKAWQYANAEACGVAVPRTISIASTSDMERLGELRLPYILKPTARQDMKSDVLRNIVVRTFAEQASISSYLHRHIDRGVEFIASEIVPGGDEQIYAYTAFVSPSGAILRGWVGRKLSQYPRYFGVFSTASNVDEEKAAAVQQLGNRLVKQMGVHGIIEPEFKYDQRDGQFKLMEVNLRSMMWNHLGVAVGVNLPVAQMLTACGLQVPREAQNSDPVRLVYAAHEVANLIEHQGYWRSFRANMFGGTRTWAFFEWSDPAPFLASLPMTTKIVVRACRRRFVGR
ncbi:hypothetical protein P0Y31_17390 [Knoellia sp. 3-2P3]|uniref:hypothetical protein n=1 Tax=unclassified Knoellia TaxID=2618719 RepID=UPI0023DAAE13|nr:hypothetical protein [Knoellia sp. 3-2P3]MDF2094126.1 hypothetical protein [Knoellia sp. 3-2P3]